MTDRQTTDSPTHGRQQIANVRKSVKNQSAMRGNKIFDLLTDWATV